VTGAAARVAGATAWVTGAGAGAGAGAVDFATAVVDAVADATAADAGPAGVDVLRAEETGLSARTVQTGATTIETRLASNTAQAVTQRRKGLPDLILPAKTSDTLMYITSL
jgi:hypothetical protein